jgi:hypothetical protein
MLALVADVYDLVINIIISFTVLYKTKQIQNNTSVSTVLRGRRGHDRLVVGFTTTYASNAYHH